MERIRQRFSHRRRSSASSASPRGSRSLSISRGSNGGGDKRKKKQDTTPRRLILTSDTPEFDQNIIRRFEAEGLRVKYLPFAGGGQDLEKDRKELENRLSDLEDDLEPGERYAVVAYKRPAYLLLVSHYHSNTTTNPLPRLCALVAYYPNPPFNSANQGKTNPTQCIIPPTHSYPTEGPPQSFLPIQVHLAAHQSPSLYDNYNLNQGKSRHRWHVYAYPEAQIGFAEPFDARYDRIDAQLAWSRALDCVKRGFGTATSWTASYVEAVWAEYWESLSVGSHPDDIMDLMVGGGGGGGGEDDETWPQTEAGGCSHCGHGDHDGAPSVNCIPTMAGGTDTETLATFYQTTFYPIGPPSQHLRLLSRAAGPDRIVDEVLLTFTHTHEIPWLLPGVPPTNRPVQIPLVLTGSFCAGKIARQNVYWDQASVLVQIGLLDPGLVPGGFRTTGKTRGGRDTVERIPVCGREEVQGVLRA